MRDANEALAGPAAPLVAGLPGTQVQVREITRLRGLAPREEGASRMGILAWIVLGLIAGLIARAIYPGRQPGGGIVTVLLGIAGALVGGWIGGALTGTDYQAGLTFSGIVWAVVGSLVVLFVWSLVSGRGRVQRGA